MDSRGGIRERGGAEGAGHGILSVYRAAEEASDSGQILCEVSVILLEEVMVRWKADPD